MAPVSSRTRRSGLARLGAVAVGCVALTTMSGAFVGPMARTSGSRVALQAEAESKQSVALVKITPETQMTTASVLGGFAGLLVGGVWIGAAAFAASSYLARNQDDDVSKALKGIAGGSLEALNFGGYLNGKYTVTDKIGESFKKAIDDGKKGDSAETVSSISSALDTIGDAITGLDKDIGIKNTLGSLATSASELAFQAVSKAIEVEKEYKIFDQIKAKIDESSETSSKK